MRDIYIIIQIVFGIIQVFLIPLSIDQLLQGIISP